MSKLERDIYQILDKLTLLNAKVDSYKKQQREIITYITMSTVLMFILWVSLFLVIWTK